MAFILLSMAPLATSSRSVLHSIELRLQSELRAIRADVTRAQQRLYLLQTFAHSLKVNSKLRKVVEPTSKSQTQWQSPIARTRLRLLDAISQSDPFMSGVSSFTIERLDRASLPADENQHLLGVERLWMSAKINSVALGLSLLSRLDEVVSPYPLQAHGCSFWRRADDNENTIEMRCLLSLSAWALPALRYDSELDKDVASDTLSGLQAEPKAEGNSINKAESVGHWQILNRAEPESVSAAVSTNPLPTNDVKRIELRVLPTGVITGPLGTLLIHGE